MSSFQPPRHTQQAFPSYRHIPGQTPHPTRTPEGHSYNPEPRDEPDLPDLNKSNPTSCEQFLFGIDLFNNGFWWECHEAMEGLWLVAGRGSPAGHTLQAVIQCAVAHLKVIQNNSRGAHLLFVHAEQHVSWAETCHLELDLIGMLADTGAFVTGNSKEPSFLYLKTDQQPHHDEDFD